MDQLQADDTGFSRISISVLSVTPARGGRLFALASVAIDIDGVQIEVHGIRALRASSPPAHGLSCRNFATRPAYCAARLPFRTRYEARSAMRCSTH
jgi:hypothetical protein